MSYTYGPYRVISVHGVFPEEVGQQSAKDYGANYQVAQLQRN